MKPESADSEAYIAEKIRTGKYSEQTAVAWMGGNLRRIRGILDCGCHKPRQVQGISYEESLVTL